MKLIQAKKSLGQNFLIDMNIKKKIIQALNLEKGDIVLEVGPGTGALTELLLEYDITIIAVEIDKRAIEELEKLPNNGKLSIIQSDILKFDFKQFFEKCDRKVKVLGNLPYYISSQIIFRILDFEQYVHSITIMLQKELAERIIATPNTKDYGVLSLSMALYGNTEKLFDVSPNCFVPKPKIWSSIVRTTINNRFEIDKETKLVARKLIKTSFNQRRKMISNTISQYFTNDNTLYFELKSKRPENLTIEQFISLSQNCKAIDEA